MPDLACRPQAKARHTPSNARAGTRGAMATAHKEQHAGAPRDKTPIAVGTTWVAGLEACNAAQRVVTRCARPSRDLLDPQLSPHPPDVHPRRVRRTSGSHPLEVVHQGPHACPACLRLRGRPRLLAAEGGDGHVEPAPVVAGGPL